MIMFHLLVLCLIAISAIAVDPNQNLTDHPAGTIAHYRELYRQVFDDSTSNVMSTTEIKLVLEEMSSFEQTDLYKSGLKLVNGPKGYFMNQYYSLVDEAYKRNFLTKRDSTLTDLILQTFEFSQNSCTSDYFDQLNDIYETFEHLTIAIALKENRDSQYQNCWLRLMSSFNATSMLIGSRYIDQLDKLLSIVYRNIDDIIVPSANTNSLAYRTESGRIAKKIGQFLDDQGANDNESFEHLVLQPCKLLIGRTEIIMNDINALLRYNNYKMNSITSQNSRIINRYILCNRIIANLQLIQSDVILQHDRMSGFDNLHDLQLITHHVPIELDTGGSSLDRAREQECLPKRKRKRVDDTKASVVKIEPGLGRGRNIKYPTIWSNGSRSMETKDYLVEFWNDLWCEHDRNRRSTNYYRSQNTTRTEAKQGELEKAIIAGTDNNRKVIRIEKGLGRGPHAKYKCTLSDGTISMENKRFLTKHCPDLWYKHYRSLKNANKASFRERRKIAKILAESSAKKLPHSEDENRNTEPRASISQVSSSEDESTESDPLYQ